MNLYDNTSNFGALFQGIQANNLLANIPSFNTNSDLRAKQPAFGLGNIQAAYSGASTIENIFGSSASAANPLTQFTSMMPQMNAMGNFFGSSIGGGLLSLPSMPAVNISNASGADQSSQINSSMSQTNWMNSRTASSLGLGTMLSLPSMPAVNTASLGNAPVTADSYMVSLGVAMGIIDPSSLDAATLSSLGLGASTSKAQTSEAQAAAIKKMPVISAGKVEQVLNKEVTSSDGSQKASFLTSDESGYALFNKSLPDANSKAEFINSLSSDIDKEVRLAGRGASKEVVAEIMANKIYELYSKAQSTNVQDEERNIKGYKNKVLKGLKEISMGNVDEKSLYSWNNQSKLPEGVAEALAMLPSISSKDDPGYAGGIFGRLSSNNWNNRDNTLLVKILAKTTNELTANAKDNLSKKNSL